jgi:hypothetical protein
VGLQPNDLLQLCQNVVITMTGEQNRNKRRLTQRDNVYTNSPVTATIGRPRKPEHLRRSKLFPLRLTPGEMATLESASREQKEPVAAILRKGAVLYIRRKGKDGSRTKGENQ